MRRADEQVLDEVAVLHVHAADAAAAAVLLAVGVQRQRLDVAGVGDRDHHLLVGDQVLDVDVALGVDDLGAALVAEALADLEQLLLDRARARAARRRGSRAARRSARRVSACSLLDLVGLERGQLREAQVEDRLGLDHAQAEALDQLRRARSRGRRRARISAITSSRLLERDQQALEDVRARLALGQLVLGAADDHLALVLDVVADHLAQRERARHAVDERDHVDAEGRLHRRVLEQLVEDDLGDRVALELDHEAHAALVGLVAQVGDLGDPLVLRRARDLHDQPVVAALLDL